MSLSDDFELPRGWTICTIGDLIGAGGLFTDGDWIETKDQNPDGDVRLTQLADIGDGEFRDRSSRFLTSERARDLNCTYLEEGDLLIARMPDPLARCCIFPGDHRRAITAVDVCIVRSGRPGVNHRWLMWFVNSPDFRRAAAALQSGSTRKRISRTNLSTIWLPAPPRREQDRIAERVDALLSRLDASVLALERARANLGNYRAAVLSAACEGRLVPTEAELARREARSYEAADVLLARILAERRARWEVEELEKLKAKGRTPIDERWKNKYKEPEGPDTNALPELPRGWAWATVSQVGDVVSGQTPRGVNERSCENGAVPFFRVGDMNHPDNQTHMHVAECRLSLAAIAHLKMHVRPKGTIVFPKRGGAIATNKKRVLAQASSYDLNTMGIKPAPGLEAYFWWYFQTIDLSRLGDGSNVPQINHGDIEPLPVPLPPEAEQRRIVEAVEASVTLFEAVTRLVDRSQSRADHVRHSVLKRAFEGRLVCQDPSDEPAAELVDRIRDAADGRQVKRASRAN